MSIKPLLRGVMITGVSLLVRSFIGGLAFTFGPFSGQGLPRFSQWLLFVALLLGSVAVSYTHLDVYKRQIPFNGPALKRLFFRQPISRQNT